MSKIPMIVPAPTSRNHKVLGQRGNALQWFTQAGWDLIPDELKYQPNGQKVRIPKGGWKQVSPDDFEAPPSPLKSEEVVPGAKGDVKTTTGVAEAGTEAGSGIADKGPEGPGDVAEDQKTETADKKAGSKK